MADQVTRREAIGVIGAAALGAGLVARASAQSAPSATGGARRRVVRVAHLTDIHVQPERRANEGMTACLGHMQELAEPPDLVLIGGDSIMDCFEADDARTRVQWDLYRGILKNECSLRAYPCIGNHDIWGWCRSKSGCTGSEPGYGKKRALDMLGLDERYFSFAFPGPGNGGWHCVILDSTQTDGGEGYRAFLDEAQLDWLKRDLAAAGPQTHVLVLSHIPIMSATAALYAERNSAGDSTVRSSLLHSDAAKIKNLFARHPNVKLCLSGHLHHVERVDYNNVTYLCNGAVSGNWWKGRHHDCDEGYAIIDLFDDGSFRHQYITYGWKARS